MIEEEDPSNAQTSHSETQRAGSPIVQQGVNRAMLEIPTIRNRTAADLSMGIMPMTGQSEALPTADTLSLSVYTILRK